MRKFINLVEKYSSENTRFRDYMGDDQFDPYACWYYVCQWLDEHDYLDELAKLIEAKTNTKVELADAEDLEEFDPDVFYYLPQSIQKECGKEVIRDMMEHDPVEAPTTAHASLANRRVVPRTTWLVHFSDHAYQVAHHGFTHGYYDMTRLGLTTYYSADAKKMGGYNFAFIADSREAKWCAHQRRYGRHAVLFQNSGVEIYHYADEENQVVFWGKDVPWYETILLENEHGGDWEVKAKNDNRTLYSGEYIDCVNWVVANIVQYRKLLTGR